ncbi:uncharacterized protein [Rutidosis leptorrhynchoides]|uniref:uncharacterized protein n=1 Tax=Rutidosis leptorrhynchoides TaxID=125765 RepID=UPI003A99A3E9
MRIIRIELDKRGVDLHSVRCPLCDNDPESVEHALFHCKFAKELWDRLYKWWKLSYSSCYNLSNAFKENCPSSLSLMGKNIWQALEWTCGYLLWKNGNNRVFNGLSWSVPVALNEVQILSFEWIARRLKGGKD